ACAGTPDCARRYPGLREDWRALLAGLPRPVTLADPLTGRAETLTLTRELLLGAVRAPLYVPALASALPHALTEAARGRFEALAGLNSVLAPRAGAERLAMGLHFAVACAEDVPLVAAATDPPGRDFGDTFARLYARACADWPRGTVPAAFRHVGPSATPVLLLSGALDPATPPRHGERVARALGAQARHVVVPNVGHGVLALGCLGEVLFRFIDAVDDGEARAVDARCVEALPPPPAYRPPTPEPAEAAR
ncbi:MAG TPA: alpha/beta hydrolase, partial [Gemmatimonadales bacterium]|nr:alpha/beta hydrolase [Gemmatimonadales bacterium]